MVRGTIAEVVAEAVPLPAEFFAVTRKMYPVPLVRPITDAEVEVETPSTNVTHVEPEFVEYSTT